MTRDEPAQGNRMARLRSPQASSETLPSRLAESAKTDFGRLRTSLKLSDGIIGTVVIVLAFCLVYLIGYLFRYSVTVHSNSG